MLMPLFRTSLIQIEAISHHGTLKIMQGSGKNGRMKIIVGDDSGKVAMYEFKRGEVQTVFSNKVFSTPITCLVLGGADSDIALMASGQEVIGLSRRGKEVYKLTSSLSEDILCMCSRDSRIWVSCEYIFTMYDNEQDREFYMCPNNINAIDVSNSLNEKSTDTALACQDSHIRILRNSVTILEIPTEAPVRSIVWKSREEKESGGHIVYGMEDGAVGFAHVREEDGRAVVVRHWSVSDSIRSAAACLDLADLSGNGVPELIVGRDDGRVQVFNVGMEGAAGWNEATSCPLSLSFEDTLGERVLSVAVGRVSSPDYDEVIVATFSGKIVSFTTEPIMDKLPGDAHGKSVATISTENRLNALTQEINALTTQVAAARKEVGGGVQTMQRPGKADDEVELVDDAITEDFSLSAKFALDPAAGHYRLGVEAQRPMDLIIVRSNVAVDYIDDPTLGFNLTDAQRSQAAVSGAGDFQSGGVITILPPEELAVLKETNAVVRRELGYQTAKPSDGDDDGGFTLICRCQPDCRKAQLFFFALEGTPGSLNVTVVVQQPGEAMAKSAKVLTFPLRALCLHTRIHSKHSLSLSQEEKAQSGNEDVNVLHPLSDAQGNNTGRSVGVSVVGRGYVRTAVNRVTFRADGGASTQLAPSMALEWLAHILNDVPSRLSEDEDEAVFAFQNCMTGVETVCRLVSGTLVVESANPSAVAITKEYVSKFAIQKRSRVKEQVETEDGSVRIMLDLLWPRLQYRLSLARKMDLTKALEELTTDVGGDRGGHGAWMHPEYSEILRDKDLIGREWTLQEKSLQSIIGTLQDMFVDWWKLKGQDVRRRLPEFHQMLLSAPTQEPILEFFFEATVAGSPVRSAGAFNEGFEDRPHEYDAPLDSAPPSSHIKLTDNSASKEWRDASPEKKSHVGLGLPPLV